MARGTAATFGNSINTTSSSTTIIIPTKPNPLTISYQQLSTHVKKFQERLAGLGISFEAAVSIAIPNSYEFVVAFLAASWQRAIAAPLNSEYKQEEFEFYIDDLKAAVVLVLKGSFKKNTDAVRAGRKYNAAIVECYWDGTEVVLDVKYEGKLRGQGGQKVEQAPQPEDIALVLHTSGTTGRPKAVPLTHRNLTETMHNICQTYALNSSDRTLLVMPLFHVHGLLAAFLAPLLSGGSVIIPPKFSASTFWSDFTTHGATWYTAVPTIHQILLKTPVPSPVPPIRFIRSCSSPLSPTTCLALEEAFKAPVLEAYAMTEAAHQMTSSPLPPLARKPGSVGLPTGISLRILSPMGQPLPSGSEGEIAIKGPNVTPGYLNNPSANASSFTSTGYFRTGDQGRLDPEGYLFITGRIKELINKGGEKVSPIEIDNVLAKHPKIAEAVSFAVEDEVYGQDVGIAVVVQEGERLREEELRQWLGERMVKHKMPGRGTVYFTDVMPKTATGKVQRRMVREAMVRKAARAKL